MTTDGLLEATYNSDLKAFEALVHSQAVRLHRIALRVTCDRSLADADDEGRFVFEQIPKTGAVTVGAFKEDYSGAINGVIVAKGSRSEVKRVFAEGVTLTGKVSIADGSPVAYAIISVCKAWSPMDYVFRGAGLGPTGADGRFRLGLGAGTAARHLSLSSDSRGQDFFREVQVGTDEVKLTLKETARVEGKITWSDGSAATGLTVRATGRLSEPPIPIERLGLRSTTVHNGLVGSDGKYAIVGLHAQLEYDIFVIDGSLGEREASMKTLSPQMVISFRLDPGEVKVWDRDVPKPTLLRGRICTEAKGAPVPQGRVGASQNGKALNFVYAEANEEGFFELHLNSGPGEYRVHVEPPARDAPPSEHVDELIARHFGKTLRSKGIANFGCSLAAAADTSSWERAGTHGETLE